MQARYGLGRIMERLQETAESVLGVQVLMMNLQHRLQILLRHFWHRLLETIEALLHTSALVTV